MTLLTDSVQVDSVLVLEELQQETVDLVVDNTIINTELVNSLNTESTMLEAYMKEDIVELIVMDSSTIEQVESATTKTFKPKSIIVINNSDKSVLFRGVSPLNKIELKAQYGEDITIYYQQVYTTVGSNESYYEALDNEDQVKYSCYSKEEFMEFLLLNHPDKTFYYITYSQKDLRKQLGKSSVVSTNKTVISKPNTKYPTANFNLYFYTSMSQLLNKNTIPINDLTSTQIATTKTVLELEDVYINEFITQYPFASKEEIKEQQVESILFIVGSPQANNSYIKMSNLRWINETGPGQNCEPTKPILGLIKNDYNPETGLQVYMLRLNVWDKRNTDVLTHVGYTK